MVVRSRHVLPLSKIPAARLAVDLVLFTVVEGALAVVLRERSGPPFEGHWVLPGAVMRTSGNVESAANEILFEQIGPLDARLEQFGVFAELGRDPRGWIASVAFMGAAPLGWIQPFVDANQDVVVAKLAIYEDLKVIDLKWGGAILTAGFDHERIIFDALMRLRRQLDWSMMAFRMLPHEFTLLELQEVHESVLGVSLNKPLFRKRMLERIFADGSRLEPTGDQKTGRHRPAKYYRLAGARPSEGRTVGRRIRKWDPARRGPSLEWED